jgi:hypothetical protein
VGDHKVTIPNFHKQLIAILPEVECGVRK